MPEEPEDVVILDADAFDPIPQRPIRISGVVYHAYSLMQLDYDTYLKVTRLAEHTKSIGDVAQIEFLADLICQFVPAISRDVLIPKGKAGVRIQKLGAIVAMLSSLTQDERDKIEKARNENPPPGQSS